MLWPGAIDTLGYGRSRGTYAHRVAYERAFGPIPVDMEVDHTCNVRACVEPSHLELVTHAENCRRRHERSGSQPRECVPRSRIDGECSRGHALTTANVYVTPRTGHKRCRQCRRDRMREHADRIVVEVQNRRAAANCAPPARLETIAALADSLCASLRIRARWSPGTLRLLIGSKQVQR